MLKLEVGSWKLEVGSWKLRVAVRMEEELMADEEKRPLKWRATLAFALAGVFVILIMAASWAAESQMAKLEWLPRWAGTLADRDPNIRTAVPFIPLSFLLVNGLWRLGRFLTASGDFECWILNFECGRSASETGDGRES